MDGRRMARSIRLQALQLAHAGQFTAAVTMQERGFGIVGQLETVPTTIAFTAAGVAQTDTIAGLMDIVKLSANMPSVATAVRQSIDAHKFTEPASLPLNGDLVASLAEARLDGVDQKKLDRSEGDPDQVYPPYYSGLKRDDRDLLIGLRDSLIAQYLH